MMDNTESVGEGMCVEVLSDPVTKRYIVSSMKIMSCVSCGWLSWLLNRLDCVSVRKIIISVCLYYVVP